MPLFYIKREGRGSPSSSGSEASHAFAVFFAALVAAAFSGALRCAAVLPPRFRMPTTPLKMPLAGLLGDALWPLWLSTRLLESNPWLLESDMRLLEVSRRVLEADRQLLEADRCLL